MTVLEDLLVWLLAAYGCSSLLVEWLQRWWEKQEAKTADQAPVLHYQILLYNSEQLLEGVVRRLLFSSVLHGKPIRISFVDSGSTDDTRKIAAVWARKAPFLISGSGPVAGEPTVRLDLRRSTQQAHELIR